MVVGRSAAFAKRRQSLGTHLLVGGVVNQPRTRKINAPIKKKNVLPPTSCQSVESVSLSQGSTLPTTSGAVNRSFVNATESSDSSTGSLSSSEVLPEGVGVARRRVVDVSDHKTCALLMAKMKEANKNNTT
ncbi:unnamed protein product [Bursaphelenchus okinawaensis]|uniref:Uncharacterized protein n=1 Tax=Bursaphelenchus okinawaensis TaxID=465554 RepID=A0A811LRT0_9BILA|nr:unnamed protein product [Bursaphelenchus okinawaensis]CAG9126966.1 unnamed protein product [Bursaphelenchus okinawaensis]